MCERKMKLICFGYWAECEKTPRGNNCGHKEDCFKSWNNSGGRLGLEGILKNNEKRYDEL